MRRAARDGRQARHRGDAMRRGLETARLARARLGLIAVLVIAR